MKNIWGNNKIGEDTKIGAFCDIGEVDIGYGVNIQCLVSIPPKWKIGNRVFIGPGVHLINDPKLDGNLVGGIIEDDVKIGAGAIIFPVTLGKGCKIGAGSVVLKDCNSGETYIGNPAKLYVKKSN